MVDRPTPFFVRELRRALRHLYDPDELHGNALMDLVAPQGRESPLALQQILFAAIEALKPNSGISRESSAWRSYRTLLARYVQQFQQEEVAASLGLSLRQMRRQDNLAVRLLAEYLWGRYELTCFPASPPSPDRPLAQLPSAEVEGFSREEELRWLQRSQTAEPVATQELIGAVLRTIEPLAERAGVHLRESSLEGLLHLAAQPATLRQALLNLLTAAIRHVPGGQVELHAEADDEQVRISIRALPLPGGAICEPEDQAESIEMACQLVALSGGSLAESHDPDGRRPPAYTLALPVADQAVVLVIDDNQDALRLFQRYLAGSRYALVAARDPQEALARASEMQPRIIVLDVMLPGIDGWELLGRLRSHPNTSAVPIVVSTILPQEQLALALGAAAFIRKPFNRAALLAVLDRQLDPPSPGPC